MKRAHGFPAFYLRYAAECKRQGVKPVESSEAAELVAELLPAPQLGDRKTRANPSNKNRGTTH